MEAGDTLQTTALDIRDGKIVGIYVMRNPDKLKHVERAAGSERCYADRTATPRPAGHGRRSGPCSRAAPASSASNCAGEGRRKRGPVRMARQHRERVEMDADGEQDVARDRQLPQRLPLDADEGAGRRLDVRKADRPAGGAVDALGIATADGRARRPPGSTS